MMQGDSYPIYIYINDNGLDLSDVTKIIFKVGPYEKEYPGQVTRNEEKNNFEFPLLQEETLPLVGYQRCEAKIKYRNGEVEVIKLGAVEFEPAELRRKIL